MSGLPAATLAFDRLAPEYDTLAHGEIFRLLRARTHETLARWFPAGCRVLEIGCGTGLDTEFLVNRGVRVVACDPSEEMVSRSLRRLASSPHRDRATVMPCGLQDAGPYLDALDEGRGFDGIVSNFGALNCVEDLSPLRDLAVRFLRPGGAVILGLMGRSCAIEAAYFLATGQRRLATRRRGAGAISVSVAGLQVPTFYHRIDALREVLGPTLSLESIGGIGVAIPPPYLEPRWQQLPAAFRDLIARVDGAISWLPPFNRLGDHVLLQFVKQRSNHA